MNVRMRMADGRTRRPAPPDRTGCVVTFPAPHLQPEPIPPPHIRQADAADAQQGRVGAALTHGRPLVVAEGEFGANG